MPLPQRRVVRRQPAPAPPDDAEPKRRFTTTTTPAPAHRSFGKPAAATPAKRAFGARQPAPQRQAPKRSFGGRQGSQDNDDGTPRGTSGWGAYKTTKESAPSKWEKRYIPPDEGESLIKFLEDSPYASVLIHWPEGLPAKTKPLYICWKSVTKDPMAECPLCEIGEIPSPNVKFNVLDLDGDVPILKVWGLGVQLTDTVEKYAQNPKSGPLSNPETYYVVQKTGNKKKVTTLRPVKARDIEEDFNFSPLTDDELEEYYNKCWDESSLDWPTIKELREVADMLTE
jgi:hypothetical protein